MDLVITMIICGIIVCLLAVLYFDYIIIVGSSIVGAYSLIRGISIFAGGYPSEFLLY